MSLEGRGSTCETDNPTVPIRIADIRFLVLFTLFLRSEHNKNPHSGVVMNSRLSTRPKQKKILIRY